MSSRIRPPRTVPSDRSVMIWTLLGIIALAFIAYADAYVTYRDPQHFSSPDLASIPQMPMPAIASNDTGGAQENKRPPNP